MNNMSINKRFAIAWLIYLLLGIVNYFQRDLLTPVAHVIGSIFPSIEGLRETSGEAYTFLGSSAFLAIPLAVLIIFKSDTNKRVRDSICQSKNPVQQVLFLYTLGIPIIVILLITVCIYPISMMTGNSFGGQIAKIILNGGIGLVFTGSFLLVGLTGMISITLALLAFPVIFLFNTSRGIK